MGRQLLILVKEAYTKAYWQLSWGHSETFPYILYLALYDNTSDREIVI